MRGNAKKKLKPLTQLTQQSKYGHSNYSKDLKIQKLIVFINIQISHIYHPCHAMSTFFYKNLESSQTTILSKEDNLLYKKKG